MEQDAAAIAETLTPQKVDAFVEAIYKTTAATRRWADHVGVGEVVEAVLPC